MKHENSKNEWILTWISKWNAHFHSNGISRGIFNRQTGNTTENRKTENQKVEKQNKQSFDDYDFINMCIWYMNNQNLNAITNLINNLYEMEWIAVLLINWNWMDCYQHPCIIDSCWIAPQPTVFWRKSGKLLSRTRIRL